ncbi:MAG: hypothetical protein JSV22_13855 [Bacteroidales bacterium]|nr:MAG: hypothetical protein JSV22_13855 [Bacteroidales bacterium]
MIIDIRRTVIKKKLRSFFTTIAVILIIVLLLFTNVYKEEMLNVNKTLLTVIIAGLYILTIIFNVIRDFNYIYYNDDSEKIVFRYFSLSIFTQKKSSIEIPKSSFAGYKIEKSLIGLIEKIVLLQQLERKIARYPAVSITALNSQQKKNLIDSLNKYSGK